MCEAGEAHSTIVAFSTSWRRSSLLYWMFTGWIYFTYVAYIHICLFCLFVFYVPSTARSFRDGTPIAKDVKLGKYTIPTGNRTPGRRVAVHYATTAPRKLHCIYIGFMVQIVETDYVCCNFYT